MLPPQAIDELFKTGFSKDEKARIVRMVLMVSGVSQRKLASRCNASESEVSRVISGQRKNPRLRKLIALELGVSEEKLFGFIDSANAEEDKENEPWIR